jgi:hypothetical protein
LPYWHAFAEKQGKRLAGSDLDAIEADSPDSAARRAIRHYWIERRQLFDHTDSAVREIVVVIAEHLPSDPERDSTAPTRGAATRWAGKVSVSQTESDISDAAAAFERTQMVAVSVERLQR